MRSYELFRPVVESVITQHNVMAPTHLVEMRPALLGQQAGVVGAGYVVYQLLQEKMKVNRYVEDILAQPQALQDTVARYEPAAFTLLAEEVRSGAYDRIVLSGMGSSHFAAYPAWLRLVQQGLPAWTVPSAELLHDALSLVTEESLLWLTSQSGASIEVQALVERLAPQRPRTLLATTAYPDSPLGSAAGVLLQPPLWRRVHGQHRQLPDHPRRAASGPDADRRRRRRTGHPGRGRHGRSAGDLSGDMAATGREWVRLVGVPRPSTLSGAALPWQPSKRVA